MKNKIILGGFVCVLAMAFVFGVIGGVPFAKEETGETHHSDRDRLIGVLITTEHLDLFDFESYLNDHADQFLSGGEMSQVDSAPYQGRLYATLVDDPYTNPNTGETTTTKKYVFEGVEGICYFAARYTDTYGTYWGTGGDEAISDGHSGIKSTDAGDSIDLKGTIFVSVSKGPEAFFYNPVYQTSAGEVYTTTGDGMSYGGALVVGMSGSHSMKDEQTVTLNGKSETIHTSVEVGVCYINTPESTRILQLDQAGSVVSAQEYGSGELPVNLTAESDAEYMIVETYMKGADGTETVSRELFQPEDESLFAFSCREDGICVKQYCSILWR